MADKGYRFTGDYPRVDFYMVPKVVREIFPHLSGSEQKVFTELLFAAYEWHTGRADLSVHDLQEATGLSRASVQAAVKELRRVNVINVEQRSSASLGTLANVYYVCVTDDPRFVGEGSLKNRPAPLKDWAGGSSHAAPSRARSSYRKNKGKEETSNDFTEGPYGVCASCGARPCAADCEAQTYARIDREP